MNETIQIPLNIAFHADYCEMMRHYSSPSPKTLIDHLDRQVREMDSMMDSFPRDQIMTHIEANQSRFNVNAFTIQKWRAAFHIVINNIHK